MNSMFHSFFILHRLMRFSIRAFGGSSIMRRRRFITPLLALIILGWLGGDALAKKPDPTNYIGHYTIYVRGFWTGTGDAIVTGSLVAITATVSDDAGHTGKLIALGLPIVDNHFSGTGVVFGIPMNIDGRLDTQDPPPGSKGKGKGKGKGGGHDDDSVVTDARIGATFIAGPHAGRIAGSRQP